MKSDEKGKRSSFPEPWPRERSSPRPKRRCAEPQRAIRYMRSRRETIIFLLNLPPEQRHLLEEAENYSFTMAWRGKSMQNRPETQRNKAKNVDFKDSGTHLGLHGLYVPLPQLRGRQHRLRTAVGQRLASK